MLNFRIALIVIFGIQAWMPSVAAKVKVPEPVKLEALDPDQPTRPVKLSKVVV